MERGVEVQDAVHSTVLWLNMETRREVRQGSVVRSWRVEEVGEQERREVEEVGRLGSRGRME